MSLSDKCPNCDAVFHRRETSGPRVFFACGSWIKDGAKELTFRTDQCDDRKTINGAAYVIRAFLDGDKDARSMGFNWIAENTP